LSPDFAGSLLGLHFDPEDGSNMVLRNVNISQTTQFCSPEYNHILHSYRRDNLKPNKVLLVSFTGYFRDEKIIQMIYPEVNFLKNIGLIISMQVSEDGKSMYSIGGFGKYDRSQRNISLVLS
jgi:hypothetical protein